MDRPADHGLRSAAASVRQTKEAKKMKSPKQSARAGKSDAEIARLREIRSKNQERPTLDDLLADGDYAAPMPLGVFLQMKQLMRQLKLARAKAKLSLADLARRTKIDRGYLSKLENMQQSNTTLETVSRIANALGLELCLHAMARSGR
jgi:DNA-binding phage protein